MAETAKPTTKQAPKKRTVLTDAERIAKAERELAEIRTKVQEKAAAKIAVLEDKVTKATEAHRKTEARLASARAELNEAKATAAGTTTDQAKS